MPRPPRAPRASRDPLDPLSHLLHLSLSKSAPAEVHAADVQALGVRRRDLFGVPLPVAAVLLPHLRRVRGPPSSLLFAPPAPPVDGRLVRAQVVAFLDRFDALQRDPPS